MKTRHLQLSILSYLCLFTSGLQAEPTTIAVDVWADNWFALYADDKKIKEDSVAITTERSFNAESFTFSIELPAQINMIVKDFKENDTGLEYIGSRRQQMGDGGFIAQFTDTKTGDVLGVTDNSWVCMAIHRAPLNKSCEKSSNPEQDCQSEILPEPANWMSAVFDDSQWPKAFEYSENAVSPKFGYDDINWVDSAKLIWTEDLETDNTLLCRFNLKASE